MNKIIFIILIIALAACVIIAVFLIKEHLTHYSRADKVMIYDDPENREHHIIFNTTTGRLNNAVIIPIGFGYEIRDEHGNLLFKSESVK